MASRKEVAALLRELKESKKTKLDADGYAEIHISVADDSEFLSVFSPGDQAVISSDTAEYIEHSIKHVSPKAKLHFIFKSKQIDEQEKRVYDGAIRSYYHAEFIELCREMRRNARNTMIMVFLAAVIFGASIALDVMQVRQILMNMLDVIAWVFMWEAVDIFVFERSSLRLRRMRYLKIIKSKISFE